MSVRIDTSDGGFVTIAHGPWIPIDGPIPHIRLEVSGKMIGVIITKRYFGDEAHVFVEMTRKEACLIAEELWKRGNAHA